MKRWNLGRVYHRKGRQEYYEANSRRGIDAAADQGFRWIDLDSVPVWSETLDRYVSANTHWPRPLLHGFHDPFDLVGRQTPTARMTTFEIERLRAPGGYRIRQTIAQLRYAAFRGVSVLDEKKYARPFESAELHEREHHAVQQIRETQPDFHVVVAVLSTHHRADRILAAAQYVGRPTCLLAASDYPAEWIKFADYKRGTGKAIR